MNESGGSHRTMKIGQQLLWRDTAAIDEKGRLGLPRKMQAALGEKFVLWKKPNGSLGAFPEESWNELIGRALAMDPLDPERDRLLREFGYNAVDDISCDQQGRFVIPQDLRDDTGLKNKEVDIVGVVTHLEIWPKGKAPKV